MSLSIFDKGVVCVVLVIVLTGRGTGWGRASRITEGTSVSCFSPSPPHAQAIPPLVLSDWVLNTGLLAFKHLEPQEVILFAAWYTHV